VLSHHGEFMNPYISMTLEYDLKKWTMG